MGTERGLTIDVPYQNLNRKKRLFWISYQLLKPESDPAWLETPWVLFLAPSDPDSTLTVTLADIPGDTLGYTW
jgi:hypothetical protein